MLGEKFETDAMSEPEGIDEFLNAYIEAALWSSTDDTDDSGGEPLDRYFDEKDFAPETLARMRGDSMAFLNHKLGGRLIAIAERLEEEGKWALPGGARCSVMGYAGHDAWLSRNGHGCGFWGGDWPKGIGEGLDTLAKELGPYDLHLGDDGMIYGC